MHYYTRGLDPVLLKDITTPAKAYKADAVPSVTTILSGMPNDYLDNTWKPKMLVDLARKYSELDVGRVKELMWGVKQCPKSGDMISSATFGTKAHARMEQLVDGYIDDGMLPMDDPYDDVCKGAFDYILNEPLTPVHTELPIGSVRLKTAGTIDLLALDRKENYCLIDYKFRECGYDYKLCKHSEGKFYDKDLAQLAIEACMVAELYVLDYIPDIYTFCIDTLTGNLHVKKWSEKKKLRGEKIFMAEYDRYWSSPLLGNKNY
jgi:hypothetical protein